MWQRIKAAATTPLFYCYSPDWPINTVTSLNREEGVNWLILTRPCRFPKVFCSWISVLLLVCYCLMMSTKWVGLFLALGPVLFWNCCNFVIHTYGPYSYIFLIIQMIPIKPFQLKFLVVILSVGIFPPGMHPATAALEPILNWKFFNWDF